MMAQDPPAYCIGNFVVTNGGSMVEYAKHATPIMQKFGGRIICSDPNATRLEGELKSVLVIIEFPSMKAAEDFYFSPEYTAVKHLRIDATEGGFLALSNGLSAR